MLKLRMRFAIDSQKELNAQAPNQTQPPAQESTESTSKSGALPEESDPGESGRSKIWWFRSSSFDAREHHNARQSKNDG